MIFGSQRIWRHLKLRGRLITLIVAVVTIVVAVISSFFMTEQQQVMRDNMVAKSQMMREELGKHGLALAKNVALAAERALAMNDLLFLAQIIDTTQENDTQFVYGALINADGRVLIHTDRAQAGTTLSDPATAVDRHVETASVRDATYQDKPIMEVVAPLNAAGKRWGVVRFGLSLEALNREIAKSEQEIALKMRQGVLTSLLVALILTGAGVALGTVAAEFLVRPLGRLMDGVQQIQAGKLDHTVVVEGSPEFVDMARAFNDMTLAVRRREGALEDALREADEANRLKSEFLANISHELRTPLNAILNVPSALLEDFETVLVWECPGCKTKYDPDPETPIFDGAEPEKCPACNSTMRLIEHTYFTGEAAEHKHFNQRALHSGRHLLHVVNDVLDFSKLQAAKMELVLSAWPLKDLVDHIRDTVQGLADAKRLTFSVTVPPELTLYADQVRLSQVMINLLGNAIKFTPERGTVALSAEIGYEGDASLVHFMVQDSGIGIPTDKLGIIFEAFRQAEGGHTRAHGGTGLGLAITAQLVQMHHGKVWAESETGKGSCFHVVMPRRQPQVESAHDALAEGTRTAGTQRRVVIVDDDDFYLEVGSRILRDVGYDVELVQSSEDAVMRIVAYKPDFVIMDVIMPDQNGVEVLRRLKSDEATRDIPVVISTGFHTNEGMVRQLGGLWLPKPWTAADLEACLAGSKESGVSQDHALEGRS